jgi:hypothetical protein
MVKTNYYIHILANFSIKGRFPLAVIFARKNIVSALDLGLFDGEQFDIYYTAKVIWLNFFEKNT